MATAIIIVAALVTATVLIHYEALLRLSDGIARMAGPKRGKMLLILFGVMTIHLIEISLYGVGYWFGDAVADVGNFAGRAVSFVDYIYFSAETYTTLGLGDIYPVGDLRLIASIESLNGLILLGWSASFTYLEMEKYWRTTGHKRN